MTGSTSTLAQPGKILLATDLSARCDRALDRAAMLAREWNAELVAVHALEQPEDFYAADLERRLPSWRRSPDIKGIVEEQLRRDMAQVAPSVTAIVEKGEPSELILRTVEAYKCGLIVTGLARDETLGRYGLGVTVDRLLRRMTVPLLIVKERARSPYRNIVLATDLSEPSRRAVQTALTFFSNRKLTLFHAFDAPMPTISSNPVRYQEEYRKIARSDCEAFLASMDVPSERRREIGIMAEHGEPSRLIRQYVRDLGVDLVAIGTHGRSALFDILVGGTAKDILSALPCDALVVRAAGRA